MRNLCFIYVVFWSLGVLSIGANVLLNEDTKLIDKFLLDVVPTWFNQRPSNQNGTYEQLNKALAMSSITNDDVAKSSPQTIIQRSGFSTDVHYVASPDGYITQLIRIVNPKADQDKLKQPPVLMFHGATIDPTCFVWSSAIEHHPEKWPRSIRDGPMTSSNRSIAFMLANNGYDVWLIGTRGSNPSNQGHFNYTAGPSGINAVKYFTNELKNPIELKRELDVMLHYWNTSYDELIQYEIPTQIDRVLNLTGASSVTILTYSYSSTYILALLGSNKNLASKVHNFVCIAPVLNQIGQNHFIKLYFSIMYFLKLNVGSLLFDHLLLSQLSRDVLLKIGSNLNVRYTLLKFLVNLLCGSSGKYQTFLEPATYGHLLMQIPFKMQKHISQMLRVGQIQKFDYGDKTNMRLYGTNNPPEYKFNDIHIKQWFLITASHDNLATPNSAQTIVDRVEQKPDARLHVENYAHLDLMAAFDNDKVVNIPILEYLNKRCIKSQLSGDIRHTSGVVRMAIIERNENLTRYLPKEDE